MKKDKEERKRNLNTVEHSIRKKPNIFSKNRQCIDWEKKRKKAEHLWTLFVDMLFWLVEKKWKFVEKKKKKKKRVFLSFEATIKFFFLFHIMKKKKKKKKE